MFACGALRGADQKFPRFPELGGARFSSTFRKSELGGCAFRGGRLIVTPRYAMGIWSWIWGNLLDVTIDGKRNGPWRFADPPSENNPLLRALPGN